MPPSYSTRFPQRPPGSACVPVKTRGTTERRPTECRLARDPRGQICKYLLERWAGKVSISEIHTFQLNQPPNNNYLQFLLFSPLSLSPLGTIAKPHDFTFPKCWNTPVSILVPLPNGQNL